MMLQLEQAELKRVITEAVTSVCRDHLKCKSHFSIEGLLGITIDQEQVVLVNINEKVASYHNSLVVSTTVNGQGGLATPDNSPKVQTNGNVLCSIVAKSPMIVAPTHIPKANDIGSRSLPNSPKASTAFSARTISLDSAHSMKLCDLTQNNARGKHKAALMNTTHPVVEPRPAEPPQKKRLLEEHLISHIATPLVQPASTGASLLGNIVVKKETVSDEEEDIFCNSSSQPPRIKRNGVHNSQNFGLDLEQSSGACTINTTSTELRKLVKSDKMWNQSPAALITITGITGSKTNETVSMSSNLSLVQQLEYGDVGGQNVKEEDEEDEDTASYLSGGPYDDGLDIEEDEYLKLARSILLYKGTFITVHSYCKVSRRTGKNASLKISSDRACWVMQKMNVPAWDEKYIGEYKELAKGTKVFFKCPPDMVNPVALSFYNIPHQAYVDSFYEESRSASFPSKTELLRRILDASPY